MSTTQIIIFKYCPLPFLFISCLFLACSLVFLSLLPHLSPTASSPFSNHVRPSLQPRSAYL